MTSLEQENLEDILKDIKSLCFGFVFADIKDFAGSDIADDIYRVGMMIINKVQEAQKMLND